MIWKNIWFDLKIKVYGAYFQKQPRESKDACLMEIGWFHLKSAINYRADNIKLTQEA